MNTPNDDKNKPKRPKNLVTYIISTTALIISILSVYHTTLKPFALKIRIAPVIQIQYKGNFGLYLDVNFFNDSPRYGSITRTALVLYKTTSPEDKYLLTLYGFRLIDKAGIYSPSDETLPLFFEPWQRSSKIINFIYMVGDEDFPISSGTYICELFVWIDDSKEARYINQIKFEISADLLKRYVDNREKRSTYLEPTYIVGYTPLISKKLADGEYRQLK